MTVTDHRTPEATTTPAWTGINHLALNLPDENALHDLRRRLTDAGCEVTDIIDHGSVRSVYFTDPNGIALEASWWVRDVTGLADDYEDTQRFGDPNPVPALAELRTTGTLTSAPAAVAIASTNVSFGGDLMMSRCLLPL